MTTGCGGVPARLDDTPRRPGSGYSQINVERLARVLQSHPEAWENYT